MSNKDGRKRKKRRLTAQRKFDIVMEAAKKDKTAAEILRREGIYSSDLQRFRKKAREGAIENLKVRRGPSEEEKRIQELESKLEQKDKLISELSMERSILSKKVNGE